MNRVLEIIHFCRQAEMSGGPFGIELALRALRIRSPWAALELQFCESDFYLGGDWHWSLTRIVYGYNLVRGVLDCRRGIVLKAPNELVFAAYTDPRTGEHSFGIHSFRYRTFFWHRYLRQIGVYHDFDLFPRDVQEWVLDMASRHFHGQRFGYIVIRGTEEAWEAVTKGKYVRSQLDFR
ncbi:hypothetical protein K2Y11_03625 [bacterium]|nr:hypothetical protein [bacterium]